MVSIRIEEIGRVERDILAFRFFKAIKASTEDPQKKQQILDRMQREGGDTIDRQTTTKDKA